MAGCRYASVIPALHYVAVAPQGARVDDVNRLRMPGHQIEHHLSWAKR